MLDITFLLVLCCIVVKGVQLSKKTPSIGLGRSKYRFTSFTGTRNPFKQYPNKSEEEKARATADRVKLGTLNLPSVGIGSIAWFLKTTDDRQNIDELLNTASALDVNFFDTAERYGTSPLEAFGSNWGTTESVFNEHSKKNFVIATKFTPTPSRTSPQSVVDACEASCKRLGVDSIDLYQIHMPDIVQPLKVFGITDVKDEKYWEGLAQCYHKGLVRNVGVCNYGPTLLLRAKEKLDSLGVPLVSNQINYSLLYRGNGAQATVDAGKKLGIKTFAYYPLAMGILTGKYSQLANTGKYASTIDQSSTKTSLERADLQRYAAVEPLIEVMRVIAERRQRTIAQVALNWIICQGAIPIPGARNAKQLVENSGARGWRLSTAEVDMLTAAANTVNLTFEGAGFKRSSEKFVGYGMEQWKLD